MRSAKNGKDPNLEETVISFAKNDLEVAKEAAASSASGDGEARVVAHENGVDMLESQAEVSYEIARMSVPHARIAMEETRVSNRKTQKIALEAAAVAKQAHKIASNAATLAGQAIIDQVRSEARGEATKTAAWAKKWKERKAIRIADAVASAQQPFHLAMLRAQKAAAQTHAKAISAMNAAKDLAENAEKMAALAQAAQANGKTYEATQLMISANGAMGGAANLKKWAENLYGVANKINSSIGDYQIREGLAAGHAAVTTSFNPPPPFPPAAA